jgi:hypothetical protein
MFDVPTLLLLAVLATPATPVVPTATDSVLASVVSPLVKPGDRLRVRSANAFTQGAAITVDPFGLELRSEPADLWDHPRVRPFAWPEIQRIDLRTRRAGEPAMFGAVVGSLLGIAAMLSLSAYAGASDGSGVGSGGILLGGALGGIAGACVGGMLGGLADVTAPPWKTIYERR